MAVPKSSITTPVAKSLIQRPKKSVSDLANTKWLLNSSLNILNSSFNYSINFISNETEFNSLSLSEFDLAFWLNYDKTWVYYLMEGGSDVWTDEAYRTIEITGGTDVTNATLISWLQANATQIQEQSNTFSFGNLPIENVYFGTRQVKKVYLGNALVWEKDD